MISLLFENPWWIIFTGVIIEAVLGIILYRTGRGALVWAMLAVLVLMVSGVIVERLVVTERERVEMTLDGIVAALEANDLNRVLSYVALEAVETRRRAAWAMSASKFKRPESTIWRSP